MVKSLFFNAFILISFLFIGGQFFKDSINKLSPFAPIKTRLFMGIFSGLFGSALMIFNAEVIPGIFIDFRYFGIVVAAVYGGWLSSITTGLIIAFFRLLWLGVSYQSIIVAATLVTISIGCGLISGLKIQKKRKWILMILFNILMFYISINIFLVNKHVLNNILLIYSVVSIILGIMVYYLASYIEQSNMILESLKEEITKDFLTGLNNVRAFDKHYNAAIEEVIERGQKLSILFIDIDFFKKVNDTYGHSAGDMILKELGALLVRTCRSFDIVSRNGGEEFSVLLLDCPLTQAVEVAERILRAVSDYKFQLMNSTEVKISVSIGVASFPETTDNIEKLKEQADSSLYLAKHSGRNKVCTPNNNVDFQLFI